MAMVMTPDDIRQLGEALYGPRWRGPMARALGCDWNVVQAWATGRRKPSRRYAARLARLTLIRLVAEGQEMFPEAYR